MRDKKNKSSYKTSKPTLKNNKPVKQNLKEKVEKTQKLER